MLPYKISEVVFIIVFLIFAIKVDSQRIVFRPDDDDRPRPVFQERPDSSVACDSRSYCVPIRRCRILRNRRDWRTAGVTCEYGYGEQRSVCCPRRGPPITTTTTTTTTTRRPIRQIPRRATPPVFDNSIAECGQSRTGSNVRPFIMGGENATEGAWPWMAAITIRENSGIYTPWCTGFLIDRIHVLSAAHCFDRRQEGLYSTRIGRVNQNQGEDYPIARITVPEGYRPGFYYDDIAILTLNREVTVPNFNPICLPDEEIITKDLTNMGATVAGWGADRPRGDLKLYLQQLSQIPIVSNQRCNRVFRETLASEFRRQFPQGINSGFVCAGFDEAGKDACGGDSGGPLMYQERNRWFAIGVVSFGFSCGQPGIPGGYTRITNHLDWIRENTRD